jgi:hypothetical protein
MSTQSSLRVAIFGNGPSALVAAHAVSQLGGRPFFFGENRRPSPLYGCQYLHTQIPGVEARKTRVYYELRGSALDYRDKVYGRDWKQSVSPEDLEEQHTAWDLRETYAKLWKYYLEYRSSWSRLSVSPETFRTPKYIEFFRKQYDMCISTIPARFLCAGQHTFSGQEIWASGDAPELGIKAPVSLADDTIVCNGEPEPSWYRASRVFGHATVEWPGRRKPPFDGVKKVVKPLWSDCTCVPWIHRLGRYGSWQKGILVHDVYEQTKFLVQARMGNAVRNSRPDFCMTCFTIAVRKQQTPEGVQYFCLRGHNWKAR